MKHDVICYLSACMHRRVTVVVLSVCLSVKSHLTSGASVRPKNAILSGPQRSKICGVLSETTPLQRSSTPSIENHTYSNPFFSAKSTHAQYSINHVVMPRVLHFSAFVHFILFVPPSIRLAVYINNVKYVPIREICSTIIPSGIPGREVL